jgi:hypothetical protein
MKFSRLEEFDDPFEGRPYAEAAYPDPEKQIHATRRAHVRAQILRGVSRKVAEREVAALTIEDCRQNIVKIQEKMRSDLAHDCQLLSLSASRDHPMLWSLYADMHRGVCIHFDSNVDPISVALRVTYSEHHALLPVPRHRNQTSDELLTQCALLKAKWWEHQEEFRLLRLDMPGNRFVDLGLKWNGQIATLPPAAIAGLTLGARIDPAHQRRLVELCRAREPAISVWQAKLADREFALIFEQVA